MYCKIPYYQHILENFDCPKLSVPLDDHSAYQLSPDHRFIYDRLFVAHSQDIPAGPVGVHPPPDEFPVFVKPTYNLRGMGIGAEVQSDDEYQQKPGYMWMRKLEGRHVSSDMIVQDGSVRWFGHQIGCTKEGPGFRLWRRADEVDFEGFLRNWIGENLPEYSGFLNVETIGGEIIECHLRVSPCSILIYGRSWFQNALNYLAGKTDLHSTSPACKFLLPVYADTYTKHRCDVDVRKDIPFVLPTLTNGFPDRGNPPRKALLAGNDLERMVRVAKQADQQIEVTDAR